MTEVLQLQSDTEIASHYLADRRQPRTNQPWITLGMIASLDGSAVVAGGSTPLGGPPDRAVFRALRAVADVIVVGATTVNAEGYRAVRLPDDLVKWRTERGLPPVPRVAVVSNRLALHLSDSLLASRPMLITSQSAPRDRLERLAEGMEVIVAGTERVDFPRAMEEMAAQGVRRITLEGGPTVNGQMAGLVDEVCMTVAPVLAGGTGSRIVVGGGPLRSARLARIIHSDGFLLLRYLLD